MNHWSMRYRKQNSSALTRTEVEVKFLLALGYCAKEIAQGLNVSYRTITAHKYNIVRKEKIGK